MSKKVPYLETSPEKYRLLDGSGSSNTGCPTPTGNHLSALVLPKADSSLPTETLSKRPLDDTLEQMMEKEPENLRESGGNGEINSDLLRFWETRIPVRMK